MGDRQAVDHRCRLRESDNENMSMQSTDIGGPCAVCCVRADDPTPCFYDIHKRLIHEAPERRTLTSKRHRAELFAWDDGAVWVLGFGADDGVFAFGARLDAGEELTNDFSCGAEMSAQIRAAIKELRP